MKINRAYKTELKPNNVQRTTFLRAAGCARWAYNWGLRKKIDAYEVRKAAIATGVSKDQLPKVPTAIDLHKELNLLKKVPQDQGGVPWMYESSKSAPQEALRNLDKGFDNFYRKCKSGKAGPKGFPRFKSKKKGIGGFRMDAQTVTHKTIKLPRIGVVRLKERGYLPETKTRPDVRPLSVSISEKAGKWFASVQVEQEIAEPIDLSHLPVIGIDVGIKTLASCSDGRVFENPKALANKAKQLTRLQRSVSRKVKGSNNRRKAKEKVAKCHYRITNIRNDTIYKATSVITKSAGVIVIEDLNVKGMTKSHCLAKAVCDASFGEQHRQHKYKAAWQGVRVVVADRWYPSSKTCSSCGFVKSHLGLNEREFICDACGVIEDRDLNASKNLANLAGSSSVTACGDFSSGLGANLSETGVSEARIEQQNGLPHFA